MKELPKIPRDAVKSLKRQADVLNILLTENASEIPAPADLIVALTNLKSSLDIFLDDTTKDEWDIPTQHLQIIYFLLDSRNALAKMATVSLLQKLMGEGNASN